MKKVKKSIKERWDSRVVPNGWDKNGSTGAQAYLAKYGKHIEPEKMQDLADCAESLGCNEFAEEMRKHAKAILDEYDRKWKEWEAEKAGRK
jgi:hypothetical protein